MIISEKAMQIIRQCLLTAICFVMFAFMVTVAIFIAPRCTPNTHSLWIGGMLMAGCNDRISP